MKHRNQGFTLIELLIVIAIIGLLSSIVLVSLTNARGKARDVKRLADMRQIQTALEMYYNDNGTYPSSDQQGCGGWDTPGDGDFIGPLKAGGYIGTEVMDPQSNYDCGNYRYYLYPAGYSGCPANKGAFYVLMIISMDGGNTSNSSWSCAAGGLTWASAWAYGKFEK